MGGIGAPFNGLKAFATTGQLGIYDKLANALALGTSPIVKALINFDAAMVSSGFVLMCVCVYVDLGGTAIDGYANNPRSRSGSGVACLLHWRVLRDTHDTSNNFSFRPEGVEC